MNRELAERIAPRRPAPQTRGQIEAYRREIEVLAHRITRLDLERGERGIVRPAKIFGTRGETVLLISENGKDDPAVERELIEPLVSAGYRVAGVDVRGWGETKPDIPGKRANFPWDDFFTFRSMELGQTLFGQRLRDVLVSAPELLSSDSWIAIGTGAGALLVAHAAVLDPRFRRIALVRPLLSYRSLIEDPLYRYPFSAFLPGVIGAYEVRDLLAAIAPRKLLVINPEDARRRPVASAAAEKELAWAATVHRLAGSSGFAVQCGRASGDAGPDIAGWLHA